MHKSVIVLTAFCVTLSACSSQPTRIQTVTVEKPVPVACVQQVPDWPTPPVIAADADIEQRAAWVRLRLEQLRHYAAQLRAILIACQEVK